MACRLHDEVSYSIDFDISGDECRFIWTDNVHAAKHRGVWKCSGPVLMRTINIYHTRVTSDYETNNFAQQTPSRLQFQTTINDNNIIAETNQGLFM